MVRGRLRLYIGAAAGVGTTYAMLDEASRRVSRGTRVHVGWVNTRMRTNTLHMLNELLNGEASPKYLDVQSILKERPQVVLIDDLASSSNGRTHWSCAEELIEYGIDVIATLNVQHIASLSEKVQAIIGSEVVDFVPDRILFGAEQIELVDITPEAIRRRIAHGNVFEPDGLQPADADLFNSDSFARLRALLMRWMAQYVETQITGDDAHKEKVLVLMNDFPASSELLYRTARNAHKDSSQLVGLYIATSPNSTTEESRTERKNRIEDLGGRYYEIFHDDISSALLTFAETEGISQIVVDPQTRTQRPTSRFIYPRFGLSRKRQILGFLVAVLLLPLLTTTLVQYRGDVSVPTSLLMYLLAVVGISAVGGSFPGITSAILGPLLANWYLIAPYHTFRINNGENILELLVFISASAIVSAFVSISARRAIEARNAWQEASTLAALADSRDGDALHGILELLCLTFSFHGASVIKEIDNEERVLHSAGAHAPTQLKESDFSFPLGAETFLVASGSPLSADNHRVLHAFVTQLSRALEQLRLREIAVEADTLSRADDLRTAILRAVSHDLRSPLASIKATVSSLRQTDIEWPLDIQQDFLSSIESETDRLTRIVTNLLDLSRLEAGVLQPIHRPLSLEEVVPSVVYGLGDRAKLVNLDIPSTLSEIDADPILLERVLVNLVENALKWSPEHEQVTIRAYERDGKTQVHVIDHGPGIPSAQRSIVVQPFHRLDDASNTGGLGLGLAIADRMIAAMNGTLELRDTPRGGLTAVITLPVVVRNFS